MICDWRAICAVAGSVSLADVFGVSFQKGMRAGPSVVKLVGRL
jgi:hypothetical protein